MGLDMFLKNHESKTRVHCGYTQFHTFRKIGIWATILWLKQQEETYVMKEDQKKPEYKRIIDELESVLDIENTPINSKHCETIIWCKIIDLITLGISGICDLCCRPDAMGAISLGQCIDILKWYSIIPRNLFVDATVQYLEKCEKKNFPISSKESIFINNSEIDNLKNNSPIIYLKSERLFGGMTCDLTFNICATYINYFDNLKKLLEEAVELKDIITLS